MTKETPLNEFEIRVIDSYEGMKPLASKWNKLLASSNANTVFLTFEWISAWIDVYLIKARKLFILTISDKANIAGIAPFYIEPVRHGLIILKEIHFLGFPNGGADYLDVIIEIGKEKRVTSAIYEFLSKIKSVKWDVLKLNNIPSDSLFFLHFCNLIESDGKFYQISKGPFCPQISLPNSESEFYSNLSNGRRKKFKRDIRVIHRESNVEHRISTKPQLKEFVDDFFDLYHQKTDWKANSLKLLIERFIGHRSGESSVQIDMLSVNNIDVAGLLHLTYENNLSLLLMAVDKTYNPKISIGNVLVGLCIKGAIHKKFSCYDFLKGDESYKFHWAKGGRNCLMLSYWKKRPPAIAYVFYQSMKSIIKLVLR